MSNEELKEEIRLLKEKIELTEKYIGLQEICKKYEQPKRVEYVPYVPWPALPTHPVVTYYTWTSDGTAGKMKW